MDPLDFSRTQRIVLLIDLHPLLRLHDPNPYISPILSAARRILSFPPLASSLAAYKLFFSSLSPILSTSKVHRLLGKSPTFLSFDRPLQTLESLSQILHSLGAASDPSGGAGCLSSPRASLLAQLLLRLEHDYAWEPQARNPKGMQEFFTVRHNLVVLFSPIPQTLECLSGYLHLDYGLDDKSPLDPNTISKKFVQNFGLVNARFLSKDIHFSWVDVNFDPKRKGEVFGSGFVEREIKELGWGFYSTDAIVLGSSLVPFGLIFPYIGCTLGFKSGGGISRCMMELVLEIKDVSGKPLECKSCDLEVLGVKLLREISYVRALFSQNYDGNKKKIHIREVLRKNEGAGFRHNSCGLVLLRGISPDCGDEHAGHCSERFFVDRVLDLVCADECQVTERKPVWQLLLAFLYKKGCWALVSIADSEGGTLEGILIPITVSYALLSFIDKNSMDSCHFLTRTSNRSPETIDGFMSNVSKSKNGSIRRKKMYKNLLKDVTWSSFCETVFCKANDIDSDMDLEEIYFTAECNKSKKLRFLKCWMRQINESNGCCQIKPSILKELPYVKGEEVGVLVSQQDPEGHLSSSSSSSEATYFTRPMSEEAFSFSCLDDPEAFVGSIPQKIDDVLCSEEADMGILAERLVRLSIRAMYGKFDMKTMEDSVSNEGDAASDAKVAAEVSHLLLRNPRDLTLKYKGSSSSSLASDPSPTTYSTKNKIREHELQILFRMEILHSKIGVSIEENTKQKIIREICSLLQSIEFDLQGESFHGESLLEFAGRAVKSRYAHSLGDVIHKIYSQMEFYSFDADEVAASDSLPNDNGDDSKREEDDNDTGPRDAGLTVGASRSQKLAVHLQENVARTQQEKIDNVHAQRLMKAQERRYKAQRFSSFTSWMPDLQRVWALKPPRADKPIHESLPKMSKRRKQRATATDMVCETPMTGKRLSHVEGGDGRVEMCGSCHDKSCRSLSKALFPGE